MSVSDLNTIRQCLSFLPIEEISNPFLNYRIRKLDFANLLKVFTAAQLCGWESLRRIELEIGADGTLQSEFGCTISASQLSRRIDHFPSYALEALFHALQARIRSTAARQKKLPKHSLCIVDSTNLRLPHQLADWTYVTRHRSGVKVHTRLMVLEDGSAFPDCIVPSTGKVSDYEGSDLLVVDPDVTYLMDRGYVSYERMDRWLEQKSRFVLRFNHHHLVKQVLEEYPTDAADPGLLRDAIVYLGGTFRSMKHPIRIVEFKDDKGRLYRVATNRYDLTAREIADLYRQRWQIELFFKWLKQHLKFAKLYSYKPQAVWNHILLAMIAYSLLFLVRMSMSTERTVWELLRLLRVYVFKRWDTFLEMATRVKTSKTRGRQPRHGPRPSYESVSGGVALIKAVKKKRQT